MGNIHTTEHHAVMKRNKRGLYAIWINFTSPTLSKKKSDSKECIAYDSIYITFLEKRTSLRCLIIRAMKEPQEGNDWRGTQGNFWGVHNVLFRGLGDNFLSMTAL